MNRLPLSLALSGTLWLANAAGQPANIALHRSYTAVPSLGGHEKTENGQEYRKLTDGLFAEGPLWNDPEHAVGWRNGRQAIHLTVDLGKSEPISGVALSSAAGLALNSKEVFCWPGLIDLFISDDNRRWSSLGELTALNDREGEPLPPFAGKYEKRKIATHALHTHGRYVRFVFSARREIFLDEVEIFKGEESWLNEPRSGEAIPGSGIAKFIERPDATLTVAQRRYRLDIAAVSRQLASLSPEQVAPIRARLTELKEKVETLREQPQDKRAVIPVGDLGAEILAQQAAVWRAEGKAPLVLWQTGLWEPLEWLATPPASSAPPRLEIALVEGESRSASFNITNTTPETQVFSLSFDGLPGQPSVHPVEWTETALRTAIASALPEAEKTVGGDRIAVPSGMTRQVWLTVKGPRQPGEFRGHAVLTPESKSLTAQSIPFSLKVYPLQFPKKQALHVGGWDYIDKLDRKAYGIHPGNNRQALKVLQENFVDLPWGNGGHVLPKGKFSPDEDYASPADQPPTGVFDTWVGTLWPHAHRYYIGLGVRTRENKAVILGCDYDKDPARFEKRVATWLQFWSAHIRKLGLSPDRFSLLIIDEPGLQEKTPYIDDRTLRIWSEAIHKANAGFRLWLDPVYREPWNADQAMLDSMDELCVKYAHLATYGPKFVDYFKKRSRNQELYLYECYPTVGGFDPYSYYRLQGWMAWEMNAHGSSFWAFGDTGRNPSFGSWNNGLNQWHYSPLFIDDKSVTTGKPMEAIRESVEDFQYLAMLRDAIAQAKARNSPAQPVAAAERLLAEAPKRVLWQNKALEEPKWLLSTPIDRSVADKTRLEILETIVKLSPQTPLKTP